MSEVTTSSRLSLDRSSSLISSSSFSGSSSSSSGFSGESGSRFTLSPGNRFAQFAQAPKDGGCPPGMQKILTPDGLICEYLSRYYLDKRREAFERETGLLASIGRFVRYGFDFRSGRPWQTAQDTPPQPGGGGTRPGNRPPTLPTPPVDRRPPTTQPKPPTGQPPASGGDSGAVDRLDKLFAYYSKLFGGSIGQVAPVQPQQSQQPAIVIPGQPGRSSSSPNATMIILALGLAAGAYYFYRKQQGGA